MLANPQINSGLVHGNGIDNYQNCGVTSPGTLFIETSMLIVLTSVLRVCYGRRYCRISSKAMLKIIDTFINLTSYKPVSGQESNHANSL